MKKFVLSFFLFGIFLGLASCEDNEGLDVTDIEIPEGYALSAGTSTVFLNSSYAFDKDADWISEISANQKRFTHGDRLYDDVITVISRTFSRNFFISSRRQNISWVFFISKHRKRT